MKISFFHKTKRAFTLVEMLIVIVIIGILAAALIPRLSSARARANDTARKADLQQMASAIVAYQIDNGSFPIPATPANPSSIQISGNLISAGMSSVPLDPNRARAFSGIGLSINTSSGRYGYTTITKGGQTNNGFVLMAGTETPGGSNRVVTSGSISFSTTFESITPCTSITEHATLNQNNGGACTYVKGQDVLRYIYVY